MVRWVQPCGHASWLKTRDLPRQNWGEPGRLARAFKHILFTSLPQTLPFHWAWCWRPDSTLWQEHDPPAP